MDARTSRSRHPDSLGQAFLWALLPSLVLFLIAPAVGDAQVVTTNITQTIGAGDLGTTVTPAGNLYNITGGARPGGVTGPNLFHSFGQFDVGTGDIANFFNETGLPTNNILSRVTGGNQSQIYGTIQTTNFPGANLFLMNPAGVLFGATAQLDLGAVTGSAVREPGSFYATTADYINLVDVNGTSPFYADPAKASVLSVAPVAAFGFLALEPGVTRGTISVQGSILQVPEGQSLSLVGGDITVQAGTLEDGTIQAASLRAPGGQLNLVSVASPGEVLIPSFQTSPNINGASFTTMGTVTLKEGATLDVSGQFDEFGTILGNGNSGTVFVRGGQLVMDASFIQGNTLASVDGAPTAVDVQVSQDVALTNGASITAQTFGPGRGGDVQITAAESVTLNGFATITAQTQFGPGRGGDVSITTDTLLVDNLSRVTSESFLGTGTGGKLVLNVGNLTVGGGSSVGTFNTTFEFDVDGDGVPDPGSAGVGGNLTIQGISGSGAAGSVVLSGGGSAITSITGDGAGGSLSVTTTLLSLDEASSINSSTGGKGGGGDIALSVQNAILSGGATIASSTTSFSEGAGAGGKITVRGLNGIIKADSLEFEGFRSGIISDSSGLSRPGDIEVYAKTVSLTGGAAIEGGNPSSLGTGGNVDIVADSVRIGGTAGVPGSESHISSQNFGLNAGQVTITADQLTLDNGSIVTSTGSFSGGRGGDVEVNVKAVSLANGSTINSSTSGTGRAGDIRMNVGSLTLANHSEITNSSTGIAIEAGAGDAGNITIQSGSTVVMNDSSITTEAKEASGGQIVINAPEMVQLINSKISTSVEGSATDSVGGNITIDPQFVILQNSQIIAQANAGSGGQINVTAGVFLADPNSLVDASSKAGPQGTVNIQSPVKNLGEQLTPLTQKFSSAAALLAQRCAARVADGKFSTFVVAGREGLPAEPGGFLASPSLTAELLGASLSGLYPHNTIAAVAGSFPEYDARPIQLAKYGDACRQ